MLQPQPGLLEPMNHFAGTSTKKCSHLSSFFLDHRFFATTMFFFLLEPAPKNASTRVSSSFFAGRATFCYNLIFNFAGTRVFN